MGFLGVWGLRFSRVWGFGVLRHLGLNIQTKEQLPSDSGRIEPQLPIAGSCKC